MPRKAKHCILGLIRTTSSSSDSFLARSFHRYYSSCSLNPRPILLFHFSNLNHRHRDRCLPSSQGTASFSSSSAPVASQLFAAADCSRRFVLLGLLSSNGYSCQQLHHLSFHRSRFSFSLCLSLSLSIYILCFCVFDKK